MLDKIINKLLDILLENKFVQVLSENKKLNVVFEKLRNRAYLLHIIKYLIFGILTFIVSILSFWLLLNSRIFDENICNFISIVLAILFAYVVNRKFVFESKEKNILKEFSKFVLGRIVSMIFEVVAFYILVTCLSLNEMLVKIMVSFIVIILNYFFSKLLVFRDTKEEKNL